MSGKKRRSAIHRKVTKEGSISVNEMVEHFSVSRMTIHRDLLALEDTGKVKRIHGGAVPANQPEQSGNHNFCKECNEPALPHQHYLHQSSRNRDIYCCACCGLKAQLQHTAPGAFYATDMISGKILPAENAFFLMRSAATPCCQPSILTFIDETEASTFRSSFGGVLGRITEALDFLRTEQNLTKPR